jgi:hypothetical protein
VPEKVTLFGSMVIEDVVKLKILRQYLGFKMCPKSNYITPLQKLVVPTQYKDT